MEILVIAALLGLIPAVIAKGKGRSFGLWWLYGAAIFIVALPHALIIKADQATLENQQLAEGMKKCPHCAEMIKADAKVCRYCSRDLPALNYRIDPVSGLDSASGLTINLESTVGYGLDGLAVDLSRFYGMDGSPAKLSATEEQTFQEEQAFQRWIASQDPPIVKPTSEDIAELRKAYEWKLRNRQG